MDRAEPTRTLGFPMFSGLGTRSDMRGFARTGGRRMPLRLTMDQAATPKGRKPDSIPFRKDENELIEEGLLDGVMAWHPRNDAFGTDSAKRVEDAFEHVERSLHNLRAILGMPARGDDGRAA